jgi:hypothetical protein
MHASAEKVKVKRGRPVRGVAYPIVIGLRVDGDFMAALEKLRTSWPDKPSGAEVIRRLVAAAATLERRISVKTSQIESA